jgi:hypothetical protein
MKMTDLLNILKLAYFSKTLYYSKFLWADLQTSRSRSIKGTNCYSRNKIPVKICCPVSFSTYLEMTTLCTLHRNPVQLVLVQLHRYHTDIGGRKRHMRYGEKVTSGMTQKSFTVYATVHVTV